MRRRLLVPRLGLLASLVCFRILVPTELSLGCVRRVSMLPRKDGQRCDFSTTALGSKLRISAAQAICEPCPRTFASSTTVAQALTLRITRPCPGQHQTPFATTQSVDDLCYLDCRPRTVSASVALHSVGHAVTWTTPFEPPCSVVARQAYLSTWLTTSHADDWRDLIVD